jgi:hypothetical protein
MLHTQLELEAEVGIGLSHRFIAKIQVNEMKNENHVYACLNETTHG